MKYRVFWVILLLVIWGRATVHSEISEVKEFEESKSVQDVRGLEHIDEIKPPEYVKILSHEKLEDAKTSLEESQEDFVDKGEYLGEFNMTAYDLNEKCCSKSRSHPAFGITASGFDLKGLSREEAQTVAVDPKIIPLGSKLYLEFEGKYELFSGIYYARDTGSAIKGKKLDLFMGDFG